MGEENLKIRLYVCFNFQIKCFGSDLFGL